jgi:uncharacterized protein YbjT (DUF2867 family)
MDLRFSTIARLTTFAFTGGISKHPREETQMRPTLVLGGTGKTGRRVAERLARRDIPVRLGSRSGEPPFDWTDQATWEPALRDVSSVYVTYYPDVSVPEAASAAGSFAKLAVAAGAGRLVLLSGRGEQGALNAEQAVRDSGADWTIVRSSFFAQNFSEDFLLESVLAGEVAFPGGDVAEPFIDAGDIADVAVAALTEDGHSGRLYEVTGRRLLTFAEAVGEIADAAGRDIRYVPVTMAEFASMLAEHGTPAGLVTLLTDLFTEVLDGRNAHLDDGVQRALGRPPRDFADYARDAAASGVWAQ